MFCFFFVSFLVMLAIYMIFYIISFSATNGQEKFSAYEWVWWGVFKSNNVFLPLFFISILFLAFDVEIVLLIPFTYSISGTPEMVFILILLMGLVYESLYGSLEWL